MTGNESSMPRVSVVLCSYNQSEYLPEAVESVLGQSMRDFELIVIDNGSTDGSQEILKTYASDPRVRLVLHSENQAVSKRMNEGVGLARGEFLCWLYSDDYYLPTRLEKQLARFEGLPSDYGVVYGPAFGYNQNTGRQWIVKGFSGSGAVLETILNDYRSGQIDMLSPMVKTEAYRRYPFHEDIFAEGEVIYYRVAMTYKFCFLDEPLVVIRDHGANRGKAIRRNAEMTFKALERLEVHPDFSESLREPLRRMRTEYWRNLGWQAVRLGDDVSWARNCYRNALRLSLGEALHPKVIAGLGMTLLPAPLRRQINTLGHRLRGGPGNAVLVDGYGGGDRPDH